MTKRRPNHQCVTCTVDTYVRPSLLVANPVRFCSKACYRIWYKVNNDLTCPQCEKQFSPGHRRTQKYCSRSCSNVARKGTIYDGKRPRCRVSVGKRLRASILQRKKEECELCRLVPSWNGLELVLQVDHIDGNRRNNSPENLRLLCPNCHSQTPTFGGRNVKRTVVE